MINRKYESHKEVSICKIIIIEFGLFYLNNKKKIPCSAATKGSTVEVMKPNLRYERGW